MVLAFKSSKIIKMRINCNGFDIEISKMTKTIIIYNGFRIQIINENRNKIYL